MPNDDMGNTDNITEETIQKAAKASGQSIEEAKKNTLELLTKKLVILLQLLHEGCLGS